MARKRSFRVSRRTAVLAGVAAVIALTGVMIALEVTGALDVVPGVGESEDPLSIEEGVNAAEHFAGGPDELLFLSGSTLQRKMIDDQEEETVDADVSTELVASPGSQWLVYRTVEGSGEDVRPVLNLYDPGSKEHRPIGTGIAPLWHPTGQVLAFLRPTEPSECLGDRCDSEVEVVVFDPETDESSRLLGAGRHVPIAWASSHLLVADAEGEELTSVSLEGETTEADLDPQRLVAVSPDGRRALIADGSTAGIVTLEQGVRTGETIEVELPGTIQAAAWSPDATRVAITTSEPSQVLVVPGDGDEPQMIEQSEEAVGPVLWSVNDDNVVITKEVDPSRGLKQAHFCPVEPEGSCRVITSWTDKVVLLRME